MIFRLASRCDANKLAILHEISSFQQPGGFMFRLGIKFLSKYYQILLDEGSTIIICAVDEADNLIGFVAGSLKAESRMTALKKHRVSLLMTAIPALIRQPALIFQVISRHNSGSAEISSKGYVVQSGTHVEFWAWQPNHKGGGAFQLFLKWLALMRLLGVRSVTGEVDKINELILKAHKMLGATIVKEFNTPDGRERYIIRYLLK